ncbi:MAG: FAD-dependent oxidoreductase [Oscillospiraceae bacterium]|nr:FAD-dependent oxidoreductase [Oscillospiraceae bacterium]
MKFTPGIYTATATGYDKKVPVTVEMTFSEERIETVKIVSHNEVFGISWGMHNTPIEVYPEQIVRYQSLGLEKIVGAGLTCKAILTACEECAKQAGADVEALKAAPIPKTTPVDEFYNVKLVIVGAGAGGIAGGIEAIEGGMDPKDVIIVEKQGIAGGASARSGGKILATGTKFQRAQGIIDTPKDLFDYMMSKGDGMLNEEKLMKYCENSAENLYWAIDHGAHHSRDPWNKTAPRLGCTPDNKPPTVVEATHSSIPQWRVHNAVNGGFMTNGDGGRVTGPLTMTYVGMGGRFLFNTAMKTILMQDGKAVGIYAEKSDGSKVTIKADNVLICTGGYAANHEKTMAQYPSLKNGHFHNVPDGNVGDGEAAAKAVGAKVIDSPGIQNVYTSLTCGVGINEEADLIVSETGRRHADEWTYMYHVATEHMKAEQPTMLYLIVDKNTPYPMAQYGISLPAHLSPTGNTVEELCESIKQAVAVNPLYAGRKEIDPKVLQATIDRYNELCEKGVDEDFGKPAVRMRKLEGQLWALPMVPFPTVTFGGIESDSCSRVLDNDGKVIPGLYAAGEVSHVGLYGVEYPTCGMGLGGTIFFCREAVKDILKKG